MTSRDASDHDQVPPITRRGGAELAFRVRVLGRVVALPAGTVATYGLVALWAGRPRAARQVGSVLRSLSEEEAERVPWHRVVNAQGGLSTYKVGIGELQRALLESEGILFDVRGRCDLTRYCFGLEAILKGASGGVVGS